MSEKNQARLVFLAALGMLLGLIGADIRQWQTWEPLWNPSTIGQLCVHLSAVLASFTGGVLYQRGATPSETVTTLGLRPGP